jgi:hypothetical protein
MMDEDEREEYRKTAMTLHSQASNVLKGGHSYPTETTRNIGLQGQQFGFDPTGFARRTKVAGSRGAVTK